LPLLAKMSINQSINLAVHYFYGDNRDRRPTEEIAAEYFPIRLVRPMFYIMGLPTAS
jgi:hypothetical protein